MQGPAGSGGVKGVIVVRQNASTYLAFERNCPYQPYDACALVSLDRNSRLVYARFLLQFAVRLAGPGNGWARPAAA